MDPDSAIAWAKDCGDKFEVLDAIQKFVTGLEGRRYATKVSAYTAVRSYFMHNRVLLPRDPSFQIRADKPPVERKVTIENLRELVGLATQPWRSMILVKWMALLDTEGLIYVNQHCAGPIVKAVQNKQAVVKLTIPGRKRKRNLRPFYTFLGHDALESLQDYFERIRGYPKEGKAVWYYSNTHSPVTKHGFSRAWARLLHRAGLVTKTGGSASNRYGFNVHNTRDLAISLLNTVAGLNPQCIEFWAGHEVDPLGYNQFYSIKPDYVLDQYGLAEPHLNILSGWQPEKLNEMAKENEELRGRLERLEGRFETILKTKFGSRG